jgi:hypothetical protein
MVIETTYDQGQSVFIVVGLDEKAKIVESKISSIHLEVIASGVRAMYHCSVARTQMCNEVAGMPQFYTVQRHEDNIFKTAEDCANHITKKAAWAAKAKN